MSTLHPLLNYPGPCPSFGVLMNEEVDAGDDGKENDEVDESRGVTGDDWDQL